MTRILKFGRKPAASGVAKSLVVFLHGYGANGADLLGLADAMARHLPDTAFVAPDAPEPLPQMASAYQWFSIPRFDDATPAMPVRSCASRNLAQVQPLFSSKMR